MEFLSIGIVAAFFSLIALRALYPLAVPLKLIDAPTERKVHIGNIPLIGGLSAFLGLFLAWLMFMPLNEGYGLYFFCSALLVLLGACDDAFDISARLRLLIQILLGAILYYGSGVYLTTLGDLFSFGDVDLYGLGPIVTIAAVIGATNAYNMIDGIDGLAGSMSIVTLLALGFLFINTQGFYLEFVLSVALVMALVPYLLANLKIPPMRYKVFMGDAGSIFIGFTIVWLLVNGRHGEEQAFRPVTALWVCAIPLMDMVAIMIRRALKGQSVMIADRDHLHHIFLRAGFTSRQALVFITAIAVFFALIGIVGELLIIPQWVMFLSFMLVFALYNYAVKHVWRLLVFVRKASQ